ncbi:hypothetical protein D3C78_1756420 [compost metagenome]
MPGAALSGVLVSGWFRPPWRPASLPWMRGSVPVDGGRLLSTPVPLVLMPGALWMAGALGDSTGLVGPVPDAVVAALASGESRTARARAVNRGVRMVVSPLI